MQVAGLNLQKIANPRISLSLPIKVSKNFFQNVDNLPITLQELR